MRFSTLMTFTLPFSLSLSALAAPFLVPRVDANQLNNLQDVIGDVVLALTEAAAAAAAAGDTDLFKTLSKQPPSFSNIVSSPEFVRSKTRADAHEDPDINEYVDTPQYSELESE